VAWIDSFCISRRASITVNGQKSDKVELPHSGLPQGSPLSPILYLFSNADLLEQAILGGGAMAFVDDYIAWVIGNNAAENTAKIQDVILPRLKQ